MESAIQVILIVWAFVSVVRMIVNYPRIRRRLTDKYYVLEVVGFCVGSALWPILVIERIYFYITGPPKNTGV